VGGAGVDDGTAGNPEQVELDGFCVGDDAAEESVAGALDGAERGTDVSAGQRLGCRGRPVRSGQRIGDLVLWISHVSPLPPFSSGRYREGGRVMLRGRSGIEGFVGDVGFDVLVLMDSALPEVQM
jgi:hypothetical protein